MGKNKTNVIQFIASIENLFSVEKSNWRRKRYDNIINTNAISIESEYAVI